MQSVKNSESERPRRLHEGVGFGPNQSISLHYMHAVSSLRTYAATAHPIAPIVAKQSYDHSDKGYGIIPVDVDAVGRPVFSTTFEFGPSSQSLYDLVVGTIAAEDYTTRLPRDSYCTRCMKVFRIEERGGRYCVRCTGSEPWFPHVESILGDPVGEDEDEHGQYQLLLPVLRRARGRCVHCGNQVHWELLQHCSAPCATAHRREVAQRRERREARRTAS